MKFSQVLGTYLGNNLRWISPYVLSIIADWDNDDNACLSVAVKISSRSFSMPFILIIMRRLFEIYH